MNRLTLFCVVALFSVQLGIAQDVWKHSVTKAPVLDKRDPSRPTYWVASEVVLGGNTDLAISIDKHLSKVAYKLQYAEGDESYGDKLGPWTDCTGTSPQAPADSITCGPKIPVFFTQFYDLDSRDGLYHVYQIQARFSGNVRFRARYALEVQSTDAK